MAIFKKRKTRAGRRTFRDIFLAELRKQSDGEPKLINNGTLRDALDWKDDRYTRIKEQLRNENLIVVGRGGPGGAVALGVAFGLPAEKALTVFISYCHEDEVLKNEFTKHLTPLKRLNLISDWHDRKLVAGQRWGEEISKRLDAASIIVLLVSIDFINSEYCYEIEMDRALEKSDDKSCIVIPVILRGCMWQHTPFANFQALPKDGKPVTSWPDRDDAFVNIVEGIKIAAEKLLANG
jgi:hypothetical protein